MRFAIINTDDGTVRQLNEAFGGADTLDDINNRLPAGQQALECGPEVTLQHVYDAVTGQFELTEPPA